MKKSKLDGSLGVIIIIFIIICANLPTDDVEQTFKQKKTPSKPETPEPEEEAPFEDIDKDSTEIKPRGNRASVLGFTMSAGDAGPVRIMTGPNGEKITVSIDGNNGYSGSTDPNVLCKILLDSFEPSGSKSNRKKELDRYLEELRKKCEYFLDQKTQQKKYEHWKCYFEKKAYLKKEEK